MSRTISELPGPQGLPLIGSAHRLLPPSRAHLSFERWGRRYGPIYRVGVGARRFVVVDDGEAIGEILRDRPDGYRRASDLRRVLEEMSAAGPDAGRIDPGVFIAEGDDWRRQRRLVVSALNVNHLHRYFEVVRVSAERLRRRLLEAAEEERPLAILELLTSFTVDVTAALAVGEDLNTLERGDAELQENIDTVMSMISRRLTVPVPYWRWFRLPADRALDRALASIYRDIEGFVERAKARLEAEPERYEEPRNLLEGLLAEQWRDESFSDEEVLYNVVMVLLAGEDTTALTLGWTLWLLSSRPDLQDRLAAEAAAVLGETAVAAEHRVLDRLPYTEAVLREAMRLKSVGPLMVVEANEPKTVCGTRIPQGTQLVLLVRQAARRAAGRSDEFYPERWLEDRDATRAPKSLTFGAGPRFCPGRNLAFLEAKTVLSMIFREFRLDLDRSAGPVREAFGFNMSPQGLRISVSRRSGAHT